MQTALILAVSLHVLAAVAWTGLTFSLARTGAAFVERAFLPQMGAALVAVLSGAWFWSLSHVGFFGLPEKVLAVGIGAALLALLVQAMTSGPASRTLKRTPDAPAPRRTAAAGQRLAAGLLALTIVCMASARYL